MQEFWDLTFRFFSLADANVRWVAAGSVLLGASAGALGSFAYLQRKSLLGDALAHAALPGVGLAFLIVGQKDVMALLIGAALSGWLGALALNAIVRFSKIKQDAALGIVLTVFFGLGVVILTYIQKTGSGSQAGLDKFLFGQAAAMGAHDVRVLSVVALLMLAVLSLGFRRFKLISFDPSFAGTIGLRVGLLQFVLTTMIVFAVTIGLQAVGVVLIAALLITPAAAARQWTDKLATMVWLAALFGALSGFLGAYISFLAPRWPTGPWVVVVVSAIFAISILFSPSRGVLARALRHTRQRQRITQENILKSLLKPGLAEKDWSVFHSISDLQEMWSFPRRELNSGLKRLERRGMIEASDDRYRLTADGVTEGARVLRLHRLWELYLTHHLELSADHVHRDAEELEHVITPEMERQLLDLLDQPQVDPHNQEIPYFGEEASR